MGLHYDRFGLVSLQDGQFAGAVQDEKLVFHVSLLSSIGIALDRNDVTILASPFNRRGLSLIVVKGVVHDAIRLGLEIGRHVVEGILAPMVQP